MGLRSQHDNEHRGTPVDRQGLLAAHPLFKGLDRSLLEQLAPRAVMRHLKKGAVLFRKGDRGSSLYAVVRGSIRISAPSETGDAAILNLMIPGDIFGEIAMLDGGVRSADASAIEACDVLVMERRDFLPLVRSYPDLAVRIIEILCARVRRTSEQVEDILFLDLRMRLAKALLLLSMRDNASGDHIHITQRELSQMIGASRESTNKELREWQRNKIVRIERAKIAVIKPEALKHLVASLG